jgi:hypothetical protein
MQTVIDVAALGAKPGHQIRYWMEVSDRHPDAHRGRTRMYTFEVTDPDSMQAALAAAREGALKQLSLLEQEVGISRARVDAVRRELRREK